MREIVQNLKFRQADSNGFNHQEFSSLLEEAYLTQRRETKFSKKTTFAPSTIGYGHGTCARYWYLAFEGGVAEDTTDALGIANMMYGSSAHERIQKLLEKTGKLVSTEVEIKLNDPPIRGYIDVMIRWGDDIVVGEIKTTRQEAFLVRQASMKPAPYHLLQILTYMKATGKKQGFLLYENKNTQEFLVIPVNMTESNEKIIEKVFEWERKVYAAWENREVPTRPFRKNNKICKNCPMFMNCWVEDAPEGTVDIEVMEVPK